MQRAGLRPPPPDPRRPEAPPLYPVWQELQPDPDLARHPLWPHRRSALRLPAEVGEVSARAPTCGAPPAHAPGRNPSPAAPAVTASRTAPTWPATAAATHGRRPYMQAMWPGFAQRPPAASIWPPSGGREDSAALGQPEPPPVRSVARSSSRSCSLLRHLVHRGQPYSCVLWPQLQHSSHLLATENPRPRDSLLAAPASAGRIAAHLLGFSQAAAHAPAPTHPQSPPSGSTDPAW